MAVVPKACAGTPAEHPMESARRALRTAALVEGDAFWRDRLLRFADALPHCVRGAFAHAHVLGELPPLQSVCSRRSRIRCALASSAAMRRRTVWAVT
jgi:hypothetical protein